MEFYPERGQKIKYNYFAVNVMYLAICGVDSRTVPYKQRLIKYVWLKVLVRENTERLLSLFLAYNFIHITPKGSPEFYICKFY